MKNTLYDYLNKISDDGCTNCPFIEECDCGAGYTQMSEHGTCPVKNIKTKTDFELMEFPDNNEK